MLTDQHENILSDAPPDAVELFDRTVDARNLYRGDPVSLLDRAVETAPVFAMAQRR